MIGSLGFPELIMIGIVALLILGPKKLPEAAKTFGKTLREFRKTINEAKSTIEQEIDKVDMVKDLKDLNKDLRSIRHLDSNLNIYPEAENDNDKSKPGRIDQEKEKG